MKLIVGLGNPGRKYMTTKHNVGFMTVDELCRRLGIQPNEAMFDSDVATTFINGEKVILAKPVTYMNESGRAIRPLMDYFQIDLSDIVVVYDDMDLPIGKIRLRQKGSAGGHNGIKSLIQHLGTQNFQRIKIGIGRPYPKQDVVSHVLSPFAKEVHEEIGGAIHLATDAIEDWLEQEDFVGTMNRFNK